MPKNALSYISNNKVPALLIFSIFLLGCIAVAYDRQPKPPHAKPNIAYSQEKLKAKTKDKNRKKAPVSLQIPKAKLVTPIIVSDYQSDEKFQVSSRIPDVVEEAGRCTLTMTKGSSRASGLHKATPNISEMSCGSISIPLARLSKGSWDAVVKYKSAYASGSSAVTKVEVH